MGERRRGRMFLKLAILVLLGVCAGGVISAGIFAFLAIIGIFPRLIHYTGTKRSILLYETLLILGGTTGNILDLYHVPIAGTGMAALIVWGLFSGIFVGCLVMSLAETLKAFPVLGRRLRMTVGIQYMILAIAAGKLAGALLYFKIRQG